MKKCECVTTSANNPDDLREFADPNCKLCDGDGIQKRERPVCSECGDETCAHGGCGDPHCKNVCRKCSERIAEAEHASAEAAYQREVAGPLLGLEGENRCKHCGEPIGHITDDPAYRELGGYTHHPEDGPDSYIDCGDEYGTQAEPTHELPK